MEKEIWKDIEGYEDKYQVSNKGRIRSLNRKVQVQNHPQHSYRSVKGTIMKKNLVNRYYCIALSRNGDKKTHKVSRMVASAFIPNPENKPQVNHIDGNKLNDEASNLEWSTCSENIQHAFDIGIKDHSGTAGPQETKLTETDVLDIRNTWNLGCFMQKEIANAWGVSVPTISMIVNRKSWTHI